MSCDSPKQGCVASRSLITDNLMASGSPSYSEIPQPMSGITVNRLGTPLWHTTSTLAFPSSSTACQQISSTTPIKTHYAAPSPSHTSGPFNFSHLIHRHLESFNIILLLH